MTANHLAFWWRACKGGGWGGAYIPPCIPAPAASPTLPSQNHRTFTWAQRISFNAQDNRDIWESWTALPWTRAQMDMFDKNAIKHRHWHVHLKLSQKLFEIHILELIKHNKEAQPYCSSFILMSRPAGRPIGWSQIPPAVCNQQHLGVRITWHPPGTHAHTDIYIQRAVCP